MHASVPVGFAGRGFFYTLSRNKETIMTENDPKTQPQFITVWLDVLHEAAGQKHVVSEALPGPIVDMYDMYYSDEREIPEIFARMRAAIERRGYKIEPAHAGDRILSGKAEWLIFCDIHSGCLNFSCEKIPMP